VRKRKERPTTEENTYIRSRIKLSTPAATTVQARSGVNSLRIHVNQTLPVMESARIQHLGQAQPRRTLMAHGKGSTGNFGDVPDMEKMAAFPEKVPAKASLLTTLRGIRELKGRMSHRVCNSSREGAAASVASGKWLRSTTAPRRGWQSMHWSVVIKKYMRALEETTSSNSERGVAHRSQYLRVCLCVCVSVSGHKDHMRF
jgi:hypothetical protein